MINLTKKLTREHKLYLVIFAAALLAVFGSIHFLKNNNVSAATPADASSTNPCVASPAPAQWKHVIVLMFENKQYSSVIGSSSAPYITSLASKCGTSYSGTSGATPKNNWHDANYKVDGTTDGNYVSKPSYATLTNGLSPTVHGLIDDSYSTTTGADNIYNRLQQLGKNAKDYYSGSASSSPCASSNFSGAYHDAIRYYTNLGGQSSSTSTYCNTHDVPISPNFMNDVNSGNLPAFSMILPTNGENMHDNSVASGDTWAQSFLTPIFDSAQYKSGDTAVFFLWDEDTAIPNVLIAPSVVPGSKVAAPTGNPISHFSALRTWQEMLGVSPLLGDSAQAPSLLAFFNGGGTMPPPPDNPPAVSMTAPANGTTIATSPVTVSANATDDIGLTKVEFYDGTSLIGTDTNAPYSVSWNTSSLSGSHTLTAKAYDTGGHVTTSGSVTVTVSITPTCPNNISGIADTASMVINAPAAGNYHVWTRIMVPDATNNSFYLQIDAACPMVAADSPTIAPATWVWTDYQDGNTSSRIVSSLTAGNHTITMAKRETGVKIDRVLLLSDTCTPTGTGENCTDTAAPTVSLTTPTAGATVSGTVSIAATATDSGSGVTKVDFLVDGNIIGTDTSSPYQASWNSTSVADGSHTLQARATDAAGNVATSTGTLVTVKNADTIPPTAPTNLAATKNTYNEVDLQWSASTDNVGVTGYQVIRSGSLLTTITGTSFNDTTVLANTTYTYSIVAIDAAGNKSAASNALTLSTPSVPDTQPPTAPTGLSAAAVSASQVDLNWNASTDNVGVQTYYVKRGGIVIGSTATTSYSDMTVSPSTSYVYTVVAADAAGNASADSNPASVTTPAIPDTTPPTAPTNLAGTATTTPQVNLTWTPSTDDIAVTGYEIWRNGVRLGTSTTPDFGDATVTGGQTYSYYVVAFDAAGNRSIQSNTVDVVVPQSPPPAQTLTFTPSDDATIRQSDPDGTYGLNTTLTANVSQNFLMKFNISGISGRTVTSAKLQLYVTDQSSLGGTLHAVLNNTWSEGTITWNNAPSSSSGTLASLGNIRRGKYVTVSLSNYITGDGTYSLRMSSTSKDSAVYSSKEATNKPRLVITVQ